jgi:hypothetical protein
MSKRISRFMALLTALALLAASFSISYSTGAFAPQRPTISSSTARNAAIIATTAEVLKQTSEIRELPILRPVKSGAQSRAEIERMLIKNLDEQTTPAEMHATELALQKLGLAPSDFQYRPFIIKLLTEQVAGYYDPKAQEFHLADWLELEGQKPVMAHELTHALQDQHFNLRRFEKWPHGDSDAELAAHALIEGDATLAMMIYMVKNPLVALAFSRSLASGISSEQFNLAPRALRESLVFPYRQGAEWTTQLYKQGGWPMVSRAFTKLPLSSEQILHPEKYFNYERPVKVTLPDVRNLLNAANDSAVSNQHPALSTQQSTGTAGASTASGAKVLSRRSTTDRSLPTAHRPLPTSGWHRIDYDVNGEWSYYLILDQFLNSPSESRRASAGWAGDRYELYEGPKPGNLFIAQMTVWDTENDAREFFDAYVKRTERRYPGAKRLDSAGSAKRNKNSQPETRNVYFLQTDEGNVIIELRGLRVLIIEGIPVGVGSDAMVKALWQGSTNS